MVEISRDGRRVYLTNSLYRTWDEQFYPDGIRGWIAKLDVNPKGGIALDQRFLVETDGLRPHQVRLEGRRRVLRLVLLRVRRHVGHDEFVLGGTAGARRVPRRQPGHGVAVRRGAWDAGAPPRRGIAAMLPLPWATAWRSRPHLAVRRRSAPSPAPCGGRCRVSCWRWGSRFFRHGHPRWVGMQVA